MTRAAATKMLLLIGAASMLHSPARAHPANIPVARVSVQVDGKFEMSFTFDILAFVLDQTPELVLDAPMNALLDGPSADLQNRLNDAKSRFQEELSVGGEARNGTIDSIDWPSAADIHQAIANGQLPRLPVMMTATLHGHMKPGVREISFRFADVLGPIVLSTEFPYREPQSESLDAGDWSHVLTIPTQTEIDAAAATMTPHRATPKPAGPVPGEADAKRAIQSQYNRWSRAYMGHDTDTLFAILAPGYTIKTAKGALITHDEYEAMLKLRKQKHSDTTRYSTEIVRITLKGNVAAIWSRETTTDPGLDQITGKPKPVSYLHDYVDLWVYTNGKWLLKSTATQKEVVIPTSH
ncbi:MAG: nuclear transport factor 2 family protein [Fimbriimonas sp.]|nr:nuclear transport factor 2 family protein [Fimbriimonas sp.]